MKGRTILVLLFVDTFVGFMWFRAYQSGMPLQRVFVYGGFSIAAVSLATVLGGWLGDARARQLAARRAGRK